MSTVIRFEAVPLEYMGDFLEDIDNCLAKQADPGRLQPQMVSINLSEGKLGREHFQEVVSELSKLIPVIKNWRSIVGEIYVDTAIYTKDRPMGCCDFGIDQALMRFCSEHQIGLVLTLYGCHVENLD